MSAATRAAAVELRPWQPHAWGLTAVGAGLAGVVVGLVLALTLQRDTLAPYRYHLWRWQAETVPSLMLQVAGLERRPSLEEQQRAIEAYFAITSRIRAEQEFPDPDIALIDALVRERAAYEGTVEFAIRERVRKAIEAAGLAEPLPLFGGVRLVWPPVAFELTSPPQLLVVSPRHRIERIRNVLLKDGLKLSEIEAIEARTDTPQQVSIVVPLGGIAAYPAIVRDDRSYASLVETAAHEWVHHYLAFYPLGLSWLQGTEGEILNETTANIAGQRLARIVAELFPTSLPPGADGSAPSRPPPSIDFQAEMRALRLEVDRLLAEGRIAEAEAAMEAKRRYFAEHGIPIRKINQAYFAFYGTYADQPAASSPIGPKIERVAELSGDVGTFLRLMREVRSERDLDALLARLERAAGR